MLSVPDFAPKSLNLLPIMKAGVHVIPKIL
jgi:hypothetical protein